MKFHWNCKWNCTLNYNFSVNCFFLFNINASISAVCGLWASGELVAVLHNHISYKLTPTPQSGSLPSTRCTFSLVTSFGKPVKCLGVVNVHIARGQERIVEHGLPCGRTLTVQLSTVRALRVFSLFPALGKSSQVPCSTLGKMLPHSCPLLFSCEFFYSPVFYVIEILYFIFYYKGVWAVNAEHQRSNRAQGSNSRVLRIH